MATEAEAVTETPVMEEPKKDVKEKKPKAPKEKKPKAPKEKKPKTASHPPYFQMIKEALSALNEKSGSSPYAIGKYMEEKHKAVLPGNFRKTLGVQLKNFAAKGKLIKIRASYKLSEAGKKDRQPKAPNTTTLKKTRSATAAANKKKAEPAKKKAKISTPAKPKQPKSIKSPVAKRAKKTAA